MLSFGFNKTDSSDIQRKRRHWFDHIIEEERCLLSEYPVFYAICVLLRVLPGLLFCCPFYFDLDDSFVDVLF